MLALLAVILKYSLLIDVPSHTPKQLHDNITNLQGLRRNKINNIIGPVAYSIWKLTTPDRNAVMQRDCKRNTGLLHVKFSLPCFLPLSFYKQNRGTSFWERSDPSPG